MTITPLPLAGIRVLDVSTVLAAPVATTLLGDFGADVIKVEEPGRGDFTRGGIGSHGEGSRSLQWAQEGRNKRSITIDLRRADGQELLRRLVEEVDVVVTNYRPPTLEKWGIGPETLQQVNPRAVLAYVTGYGLTGPYRDRGAFDRIASAFSGLTYVSGEPERPPVRSGYSVIDYMAAYLTAFAIMTALYHRDAAGGAGQVIDLGLYEAGFRGSENALLAYAATGQIRERLGNRNPQIVPASDFESSDGRRVSIHAGTDPLFARLARVMDRADLVSDERFATSSARTRYQDELYEIITAWAAGLAADDLVRRLSAVDVPAAALMSIADIAHDEHYRERGTIVTVADPEYGELLMTAPLPFLSGTPGRIRSLGPALGAHTNEVLAEVLGLDGAEIDRLTDAGVI